MNVNDSSALRPRRAALVAACVVSSSAALHAAPALAQSTAAQSTAETAPPASQAIGQNPERMDEVTITATRRREPIRDVPLSVTVINAETLEKGGAKELGDYLFQQPGVNFAKNGQTGRGDVSIRGVTSGRQNSATVGIYVDDVPVGSAHAYGDGVNAYDQRLLDLNHIEVLKGPQGTLYGASSMGGLLKYVTNDPELRGLTSQGALDLSTTAHGGFSATENAVLNAPLQPGVAALRVAAFHTNDGGYVEAKGPAGDNDVNRGIAYGGRLSVLVQPADRLTLKLAVQGQKTKAAGASFVDYDFATRSPKNGDLDRLDLRVTEPRSIRNELATATIEYDLGFARLSSITAYQTSKYREQGDFSIIYSIFVPTITTSFDNNRQDTQKTTQELRIVSQQRGAFEWLGGLYFGRERTSVGQEIYFTTAAQPDKNLNPLIFGPNAGYFSDYKEYAAYATATWNATSALAFTAGVRQAHNQLDVRQRDGGLFASNQDAEGHNSESSTTYLAAARLKVTDNDSAYVRVASGYRPGGPNLSTLTVGGQQTANVPTYGSDRLWSYELGNKLTAWGGRASIEASIYQINWQDIQVVGFVAGSSYRINAGRARIRGAELTSTVRPIDDVTLGLSLSSINAKLTQDAPIGAETVPSGTRLPNSARLAATGFARYDFTVAQHEGNVGLNVAFLGQRDGNFSTIGNSPNYSLPSFTQYDLQAGLNLARNLDVGFYVRNLTDKRGQLNVQTNQTTFGGPTLVTITRPRTIGVTLAGNF